MPRSSCCDNMAMLVNKAKMSSSKKKNLPNSIKGLSPEELANILRKKKECNARALRIVEALIEQNVDKDWMLENLEHINQSHYEDIVEERLLSKYCGYPLCTKQLVDVPKQQYRISLSSKAVYDITERKKFCSAFCFKASEYLKSQLLTSPLWYRDNEVVPKFKVLEENTLEKKLDQSLGDEKIEIKTECEEKMETSCVVMPLVGHKTTCNEQVSEILTPVEKVEKIVQEWFTISSFIYLFGEDELKKKFEGKTDFVKSCMNEYASLGSDLKRFNDVSRLFSILNLDGEEEMDAPVLKPAPDYSALREEALQMNIKIQAFYTGQMDVPATDAADKDGLSGDLPFVDAKAQSALRRKVLLDRLNRIVPEMCINLGLGDVVQIGDIRCLVRTFDLSPYNVTMKPREWSLISLIILKILCFQIKELANNFEKNEPKGRIFTILNTYNLPGDYLEQFVAKLTDLDRFTINKDAI